jgi:hypothetical protein
MSKTYIDITDRKADFDNLINTISWIEKGLRTIAVMYDEHSSDKNSKENIFRLKDNLHYRFRSTIHMYKLLLEELYTSERFLSKVEKERLTGNNDFGAVGYMDIVEQEVSAVFDSVVFNIMSIFDYLSHFICYIINKQKSITSKWSSLANEIKDPQKEIYNLKVAPIIRDTHISLVDKINTYRSILIHDKREKHNYNLSYDAINGAYTVKLFITKPEIKKFKIIFNTHASDSAFTLPYLASWLIKKSALMINDILLALVEDIKAKTNLYQNINGAKGANNALMLDYNPATNVAQPLSERFLKEYKNGMPDYLKKI